MWDGVSETHPEFCWDWPLEQTALRDVVFPKFWESIQVLDDYYLLQSRYGLYIRHYFLSSDEEREKAMRTYCDARGIAADGHDASCLRLRFEALPAYYGLDFKHVYRGRDRHVEIDDIKFLHPYHTSAGFEANYSLFDIVLSSVLSRKSNGSEDICGMIEPYFSEGPYEYGEVRIEEGDVVFDCGANVGLFSAVASRYGACVHAFEAAPRIVHNWLSKTAAMNGCIQTHNNAVWDKEETLDFAFKKHHIGGSKCAKLLSDDDRDYERYQVRAVTLDAFVEQQQLDRVDFIKADIEGAERNMLLGAQNILKRFAPKLSLCTYHRPDDEQVLCDLILAANPDYVITKKYKKLYAYLPK
jgi:FkbM family methyltransferase